MDVYDQLWDNSKDIAEQTLELPFLQHMQMGDLQADNYVIFMIQDINYLVKVTDMLKEMCDKVKLPEDLKNFFGERYESYHSYAEATLEKFNLRVWSYLLNQALFFIIYGNNDNNNYYYYY